MSREPELFDNLPSRRRAAVRTGVLPCQAIDNLIRTGEVLCDEGRLDLKSQVQPASLDLRLGPIGYRIRASFLPGPNTTVTSKLDELQHNAFSLVDGAVLETNCVYLVPLMESLRLRQAISAIANPKSSTGRLDVFTRLITDNGESFDYVPAGYEGPLYLEISPRTFSILVHQGSRLSQLRFLRRTPRQPREQRFISDASLQALHGRTRLVDLDATFRDGLNLRVDLTRKSKSPVIGYKAKRYAGVIDVDKVGGYDHRKYWDIIDDTDGGRLVLDPQEFYILASKEAVLVPEQYAAEMAPFDPMMGEYRVHYAGFFDPGFGIINGKPAGARAVLEVRSLDIPFILEDAQIIGRLLYERLAAPPARLYGSGIGSNYQGQGLKLSKHFR
ncbi:2'-deoxycytidine 5'-triphosphate deaminase [Hyphomicrobium sp.]|uniref:2'-deoxycytidine 5'-triphosphate deaminase n=1 Tax=Hyphomicrobium sp. TaxID=82 RepID=UPI0025B8D6D9|nr:2'-deoxycytidine 5'-triphosphate deaminase [Hyphomicrobium sp.]MCC7251483.1 2'-deoxycytidine 5'-triphosphate deaminase [Hyphomicrobium sp.]